MELLILISACKGGSANKITGIIDYIKIFESPWLTIFLAVMPYFPYSKQSKKKSHRGAITARSSYIRRLGMKRTANADRNPVQCWQTC